MSAQVTWIHQMQLTRLKRNRTTFGYIFIYLIKMQLVFIEFQKWQNVVSAISGYKIHRPVVQWLSSDINIFVPVFFSEGSNP